MRARDVALALFALSLPVLMALVSWSAAPRPELPPLPASKYDDRLLQLDREAVEQAYREHLINLFLVWMKSPDDPDQPHRAVVGARRAQKAFVGAMGEIDKREQGRKR